MTAHVHQSLVLVHVVCGFFALAALWVPLFSRKGGRLHVLVGKAYAAAMLVVVVTAVAASGIAFVNPLGVDPEAASLSPDRQQAWADRRRMFAIFLSYLAVVTFASGWSGLGALRHKEDPREFRTPSTVAVYLLSALSGIGVFVVGLQRGSTLLMALSVLGPAIAWSGYRYTARPARSPMAWWYEHMSGMIGTGIGANTAFLVFGANRLLPIDLQQHFGVVSWLLPTLVGVPAIWLLEKKYRRRFGEEKSGTEAAT